MERIEKNGRLSGGESLDGVAEEDLERDLEETERRLGRLGIKTAFGDMNEIAEMSRGLLRNALPPDAPLDGDDSGEWQDEEDTDGGEQSTDEWLDEEVEHYTEERNLLIRLNENASEIYTPTEISPRMAEVFEKMTPERMKRIRSEYEKDILSGDVALMDFLVEAYGLKTRPIIRRYVASSERGCSGYAHGPREPIDIVDAVEGEQDSRFLEEVEYAKLMARYRVEHPEKYLKLIPEHINSVAHETWHYYQAQLIDEFIKGQTSEPDAEAYTFGQENYIEVEEGRTVNRAQRIEAEAYKMGRVFANRIWNEDYSEISPRLWDGVVPFQEMLDTKPEQYRAILAEEDEFYENERMLDEEKKSREAM